MGYGVKVGDREIDESFGADLLNVGEVAIVVASEDRDIRPGDVVVSDGDSQVIAAGSPRPDCTAPADDVTVRRPRKGEAITITYTAD